MVGRRVQQYQFIEKLGAGGMGEIYKAQDTRLTRTVAIKVLPSSKSGDPERRRRFLQEAQAASGLNHPSIITIHDVISDGDTEFMVMEFVPGKTLNDLIPKGGLRVPLLIKYALQMSDALSAAHAAGIVHRDLKPANVMVTESGLVKILDFGLAKMTDQAIPDDGATRTMASGAPLTVEGSILGTVSYMSPEQAQGKKVDARSDIFSFGAVLYEMATGQRAFEGESSLSTLSSILRDDPKPMSEVAPDVPPALEEVFTRCLRKNPDDRWQSMKEVQAALSMLKRESDSGSLYTTRVSGSLQLPPGVSKIVPPASAVAAPADASSNKRKLIAVAALVVVLIGGGGTIWRHMQQRAADKAAADLAAQQAAAQPEPAPAPPPLPPDTTLTNDNVAQMVAEKVPTDLILSQIRSADKTNFVLSTAEIIRMTKAGVSPLIIEQMRDPKRAPVTPPPRQASNSSNAKQPPPPPAPVTATATAPTPAPASVPIATSSNAILTPVPAPVATPAPAPAAAAVVPQGNVNVTVPDAIPFKVTLAVDIPSDADVGRPLRFAASEDFTVGNNVVLPKGATVYGEISEAGRKKMFGIGGGRLSLKFTKAEVPGGKTLNVRALAVKKGDGATQRSVDTGVRQPKDMAAAKGTEYIAYTDGEQALTIPRR